MARKKDAPKIAPLDVDRCQAEKPNGASFMTFGGVPRLERCNSVPSYVLVETKEDEDGLRGAMTVCSECFEVFKKQVGVSNTLYYEITRKEKGHA
jgi:hypothetical protein